MANGSLSSGAQLDPIRHFVLRAIDSGATSAAGKLPTERELAARFARPRSVVRRALIKLELEGRIVRQVGRGTFVSTDQRNRSEPAGSPDVSPTQLIEARLMFEPGLIELVVTNATANDLRIIEECLRLLRQATSVAEFEQCDAAFHQAIADATHNELVIEAMRLINRARNNAAWGKLKARVGTPEARQAYNLEHQAILDALVQRDAATARQRTIAHLMRVRLSLLGY